MCACITDFGCNAEILKFGLQADLHLQNLPTASGSIHRFDWRSWEGACGCFARRSGRSRPPYRCPLCYIAWGSLPAMRFLSAVTFGEVAPLGHIMSVRNVSLPDGRWVMRNR